MKISDTVLGVLDRCRTADSVLFLPPEILDRKVYAAVNKVLEAAGGKWSRSQKGHVFDGSAEEAIEPVILTGEVSNRKQEFGQFFTPPDLARLAAERARIKPGVRVLEPSAGEGALALAAQAFNPAEIWCVEKDLKLAIRLANNVVGIDIVREDFLGLDPSHFHGGFDVVLMNSPFAKRADIRHVLHAIKFVVPGGRLVAIMSAGVTFRSDHLTQEFRDQASEYGGEIERLPDDSFKESGTSVNTVLVSFDVP